ncbi:hypothetical protein CC78DRAFT_541095 [Lojkania enalia]|uniref:Heterokaryon incompatibility domain-containing protein n=1 Tax=Lojkania enalia TaxID=147567 RepID=A0A9P4KHP6_9PLEO|nr:hypothetical protein CC78DRAFT_541095 [Didymosphaeria enalia]
MEAESIATTKLPSESIEISEFRPISDFFPLYSKLPIHYPYGTKTTAQNIEIRLLELTPAPNGAPILDAVCIDQSNVPERNYQVTQMPKISSAAQEVVACLGDRTDESDATMRLITLGTEELRREKHTTMRYILSELAGSDEDWKTASID